MDTWIDIRHKARELHVKALEGAKGDRRAKSLIAAALVIDDLEVEYYEPGSIVDKSVLGFLERESRLINIVSQLDAKQEVVVTAHEIGHFKLHHDPRNEVTVTSHSLGGDPIESGAGRVEGYSSRERKELQADVFAGEFLCPSDWLRQEYVDNGRRPTEIADALGLPIGLVMNQVIRALLLPPLRQKDPDPDGQTMVLDDSQQLAATWSDGPLLVNAGPGTGKTRTLVHRIKYLLDQGAGPASILALTFSRKAAEEMRERLSAKDADAAIETWVGTLHAFGLEIITKWPTRIGRTDKVRILDQAGALALLEENLEKLPLHHFQNLYEPAFDLVHVLRAISRCKDELITPSAYKEAALASQNSAKTPEECEKAEKVMEVARIYEVYEKILEENDAVDFGDLVMHSTRMLENHDDIRGHFHSLFKHIVVDEYQDVNRASACLLRVLRGPDTGIWVVADQRQSIYRFRGAEPTNVARFEHDFGGTHHNLSHNYRSLSPVVRAFEQFSTTMSDGSMAGSWHVQRDSGGEASITVAPTLAAEAEAIRDKIEELRNSGVSYDEQVILARSHLTLARITEILEQLGVPLLYLGDLFERPEIRDLLSLMGLDAEYGGIGLCRVAELPEYAANREDVLAVIRWAGDNQLSIFDALKRLTEIEGLSKQGRNGLTKLGMHVDGFGYSTSPWVMLTTWLFERSNYLRPLLLSEDTQSQQKLIAIYHLLKVCSEQISQGDLGRRQFLERVRRIEALNEDTMYRAVASEASGMDAVRVMTIHGSKGLEFAAVHLPALATRYMPANRQAVRVPAPRSLPQLAMQPADHDAEEECLFFVALSRARDYVYLSRAEKYTIQNANQSRFLPSLGLLPTRRYPGSGTSFTSDTVLDPATIQERYQERDLDNYMQCPARYRFQAVQGLIGGRDNAAYIRFHRCVYATVGWLEQQRQQGEMMSEEEALSQLSIHWENDGPVGHGFEGYYHQAANRMVSAMVRAMESETGWHDRQEWAVPVGKHNILITPDRVLIDSEGTVRVQRIRTGRKTKSESNKPIYALLRLGAQQAFPGRTIIIETFYLSTGERVPVQMKNDAKLLQQYSTAIEGIERGDFHPEPDQRRCPNCPCYFVCGKLS